MGGGEDYKDRFWDWWSRTYALKDEAERLRFLQSWPMPPAWTHVAINMIWPQPMDESSDVFFYEDRAEDRQALFRLATSVGLPDEQTWLADLDDPRWLD